MKQIANALAYQTIWFSAILWGNYGGAVGCVIIAILLGTSKRKSDDIKILAFVMLLGLLVDGTLLQIGFFTFSISGLPIPFWLLTIWLGLAMTINHSLAWFQDKLLLAALFGGLGGSGAYWAGTRMGAASFNWPLPQSLLLLAILWSLIFPTIMLFSKMLSYAEHKKQ
jgi:hypothetical protein